MLRERKDIVLLTVVLFIYSILVAAPFYLACLASKTNSPAPLSGPFLGSITVFLLLLVFLFFFFQKQQRAHLALTDRLNKTQEQLQETKLHHEHIVEKRTLEIAVVNASLNREIAERIQAETESKELQRRLELILNSAGEGIFGLDTEGNVTFVNTAAALMVGWDINDLIGKSHHDLVHHTNADGTPHETHACLIRQAYQDGIVHSSSDDIFWTKDGSSFPVEYVSTPILDNSRLIGAVVVFRDLSTFT